MSTPIPTRLNQVMRVSDSLQRLFKLLFGLNLAAVLVVLVLLVVGFEEPRPVVLAGVEFAPESASGLTRAVAGATLLLQALVSLKATYHLIRLFGLYAGGKIFTGDNVRQIRKLGITLLLLPVVWLPGLVVVLPEVAGSANGLEGIVPSFPGTELVGGAIVILISWIMDVGRELREEHDLVV